MQEVIDFIYRSLPSLEHLIRAVITGAIVFVCLYPFRKFLGFAEKEATKEYKKRRKVIVKLHVHDDHDSKLKHCVEGQCYKLAGRTTLKGRYSAVVSAETAGLQEVHSNS